MHWIIIGLIVILGGAPVYSNADDDWLSDDVSEDVTIISTSPVSSQSLSFQDYWDEHIALSLGGGISYSENDRTLSYFLLARHNESLFNNSLKTYVSFRYQNTKKYNSILDISVESEHPFTLRELYASYSPVSWGSISIGNQLVIFGQNPIFSPVDYFTLPGDFEPGSIVSINKINSRLPQLTGKLSVYPIDRMEINAYYFPKFTVNSYIKDIYNRSKEASNESPNYSVAELPSDFKDVSKALQLIWEHDIGTLELTYYNGWNQVFEEIVSFTPSGGEVTTLQFPKKTVYGFSISKPFGNTTLRLEFARDRFMQDVRNPIYFNDSSADYARYRELTAKTLTHSAPVNWIIFGADGEYDKWILNTYLIILEIDKRADVFELERTLNAGRFTRIPNKAIERQIVPNLHIAYTGDDKTTISGVLLGFFDNSGGFLSYYKKKWKESLEIVIATSYRRYITDDIDIDPVVTHSLGFRYSL